MRTRLARVHVTPVIRARSPILQRLITVLAPAVGHTYAARMWWWIGTGVVLAVLLVLWFVMHRWTDFGARAAKFEGTDPEVADALRQAESDIARGRMYF